MPWNSNWFADCLTWKMRFLAAISYQSLLLDTRNSWPHKRVDSRLKFFTRILDMIDISIVSYPYTKCSELLMPADNNLSPHFIKFIRVNLRKSMSYFKFLFLPTIDISSQGYTWINLILLYCISSFSIRPRLISLYLHKCCTWNHIDMEHMNKHEWIWTKITKNAWKVRVENSLRIWHPIKCFFIFPLNNHLIRRYPYLETIFNPVCFKESLSSLG